MVDPIIDAIVANLESAEKLIRDLDDGVYADTSVGPYYSSLGAHLRHVLDIYVCIMEGVAEKKVDLGARKRNALAEQKVNIGIDYLKKMIDQLKGLKGINAGTIVEVKDDLGLGDVSINYTLGAALIQAHSHSIHHQACMGYVLEALGKSLPEERFGFNPTTPDKVKT